MRNQLDFTGAEKKMLVFTEQGAASGMYHQRSGKVRTHNGEGRKGGMVAV